MPDEMLITVLKPGVLPQRSDLYSSFVQNENLPWMNFEF